MEELSINNTLTRTATPVEPTVEPSVTKEVAKVTETTGDSPEMPPSLLVEAKRDPEICNLLDMGESYKHFNMQEYTNEVDVFINERIKTSGLKDDKDSYKKVFEEILTKSNPPRDDIYSMIERIREYCELQTRLINLQRDKEEFEKKSLEDMTSKELRKVIDASNKR
jgi:hypothetical protein